MITWKFISAKNILNTETGHLAVAIFPNYFANKGYSINCYSKAESNLSLKTSSPWYRTADLLSESLTIGESLLQERLNKEPLEEPHDSI